MKKAELGTLNFKDFGKGLLMAVLGAAVAAGMEALNAWDTAGAFDWKHVIMGGVLAAGAYILKNLGTNSKDEFLKKEQK